MAQQSLPDTWQNRDLPVLRAAVKLLDEHDTVEIEELAEATGMSEADVIRALRNLFRASLLDPPRNLDRHVAAEVGIVVDASERAMRTVGMWPTPESALERMTRALEALASDKTHPAHDQAAAAAEAFRSAGDAFLSISNAALGEEP